MWWCIWLALLPCIAHATACQPGWTPVSFGHNIGTACVMQSDMNLTATSAELYCMQRHATLLEFDTVQSVTDIIAQFQSDMWIGAIIHTTHTASVQLSWISGAPVNATIIPTIVLPPPDSHRRCVQLHAGSSTLLARGSLMSLRPSSVTSPIAPPRTHAPSPRIVSTFLSLQYNFACHVHAAQYFSAPRLGSVDLR